MRINNVLAMMIGGKAPVPIADGSTNTSTTSVTATMTSFTAPSGTVSASTEHPSYPSWQAFDKNSNYAFMWAIGQSGYALSNPDYLQYDFGAGNAKIINKVGVRCGWYSVPPNSIVINYSDNGSSWTSARSTWYPTYTTTGEWQYTYWTNATPHRYWKVEFWNTTNADNQLQIAEISFIECQYS